MIKIAVRINIFPEEYSEAAELTQYLLETENLDGSISIYIANKRDYFATADDERRRFGEYCKLDGEYRKLFQAGKYSASSYQYRKVYHFSTPCNNVCNSSLCIGPNGELYKCEHHFGDLTMVVGNVIDGEFFNLLSRQMMCLMPPTTRCKDCSYLPCCMGGCPDDRRTNRFIIDCDKYTKRLDGLKLFELEHGDSRIKGGC